RATIGNTRPEYCTTMGFFPVDEQTLAYLGLTGREESQIDLVERYSKEQGLWRTKKSEPQFTETLELDLATVMPSVAGPRRPQDRLELRAVKQTFRSILVDVFKKEVRESATPRLDRWSADGPVAKKAVEHGLKVPPHVKTSLAPGSRVVTDYLNKAGLSEFLDQLGFNTVGYGCTTCNGNSGPLPEPIANAIEKGDLVVASVLSGNRNFEGRINPHVKANFLASPPLVVCYALAGR